MRDNTVTNIASGGIASFKSVGQVPLKSLKVSFNPIQEGDGDPSPSNIRAISGWTGCNLHIDKKNLFNVQIVKGAVTTSNGEISTYTSGDRNRLIGFYIEIPAGTYTISCKENKQVNVYFYKEPNINGYIYSERLTTWENMPKTFTTVEKRFVVFVFRNSDNSNISPSDITEVQLESGSTSTTYEPYNGTTIPVSWSDLGTVYGGYVDLISGEVWKVYWQYTFTGEETFNTGSNSWVTTYIQPVDGYYPTAAQPYEGICSHYPYGPYSAGKIGVMYNERTCTFDYRIHDAAGWKQYCTEQYIAGTPVQIAYKLKTPQLIGTIDPIEIKSLIGQNNVWSNADTVEVQYCALESLDIYKQRFKTNEPHLQSASNNLVSFQTDMVAPLKECKVYFEPVQAAGTPSPSNVLPISGWSGLKIYHAGKNLLPLTTTNRERLDFPSGYTITISAEGGNSYGNPQFSVDDKDGVQLWYRTLNDGTFDGRMYATRTNAVGFYAYRLNRNPSKAQMELGSSPTSYEEWKGSENTITFPSTYYGGYVDITKGTLIQDWGYVDLGDLSWYKSTITGDYQVFVSGSIYNSIDQVYYRKYNNQVLWKCSNFSSVVNKSQTGMRKISENNVITITQTGSVGDICVRYDDCDTAEEFKTAVTGVQLAYSHLLNPVEYLLTPTQIKTLKNQNNFWSSANDTIEVKYWTHGSIADKRKVVWNQGFKPLNANNWIPQNSSYSTVTFENGEALRTIIQDVSQVYQSSIINTTDYYNEYAGHKYLLSQDIKPSNTTGYVNILGADWKGGTECPANQWTTLRGIYEMSTDRSKTRLYLGYGNQKDGQTEGTYCYIRNPLLIDLTQMFGAGNQPTLEKFETLCAKNGVDLTQPQPYDEGTEVEWYF